MSVNHLKSVRTVVAVNWLYSGCKAAVFRAGTLKPQIVNASADLTRSLGLLNFTTPSMIGCCGQKEQ